MSQSGVATVAECPVVKSRRDRARAPRRPDHRRRHLRHRRRAGTSAGSARARATRSSSRAVSAAAPGTSTATRGSAATPTSTPSASGSSPGRERGRSPTATRSSPTSARRRPRRGVDRRIRFNHRVTRVEWSPADARWEVEAERTDTGETVRLTCGFVWSCSGYFAYDEGYLPEFAGTERFAGRIAHPHRWPEDLEYAGKRVVVIGSGATAVSLVPALAREAEHVTMLQRSPSYLFPVPGVDPLGARAAAVPAAEGRLRGDALEGHPRQLRRLLVLPALPGGGEEDHPQGGRALAARRLRLRHPPQPQLQPLGAAALRAPRRRPLRGDRRRHASRSSPTGSRPSPSPACGSSRAPSSTPT